MPSWSGGALGARPLDPPPREASRTHAQLHRSAGCSWSSRPSSSRSRSCSSSSSRSRATRPTSSPAAPTGAPTRASSSGSRSATGSTTRCYVQFENYWERTVQWDLGESFPTGRSVNDILGEKAVNSIRLAFWAVLIEIVVGISVGRALGGAALLPRRQAHDGRSPPRASAIPVFVLGFILQYVFAVYPNKQGWPEWTQLRTPGPRPRHLGLLLHPHRRAVALPDPARHHPGLRVHRAGRPHDPRLHARGDAGRLHAHGPGQGPAASARSSTATASATPCSRSSPSSASTSAPSSAPPSSPRRSSPGPASGSEIADSVARPRPARRSSGSRWWSSVAYCHRQPPGRPVLRLVRPPDPPREGRRRMSTRSTAPIRRHRRAELERPSSAGGGRRPTSPTSPRPGPCARTSGGGSSATSWPWSAWSSSSSSCSWRSSPPGSRPTASTSAPRVRSAQGPSAEHWFGTDTIGRDVFSRVVYGARISLRIGFIATGDRARHRAGPRAPSPASSAARTDTLIMRITDIFLAIPYIVLAVAIATIIGRSVNAVILVLGLTGWLGICRIVRASFLSLQPARVRRGGPRARASAARGSSSATSCPTPSSRSSSTAPSPSAASSSPRRRCPSSASGRCRPRRRGA